MLRGTNKEDSKLQMPAAPKYNLLWE